MYRRLTKSIIGLTALSCFMFATGSYGFLLFPHNTRSLSLNNTTSVNDGPFLQNNPATISLRSHGVTYSYFYLPSSIQFGGIQRVSKLNTGIVVSKFSFFNYGKIVDSETEETAYAFDILLEMGYKKEINNITSLGISSGYMFSSIAGFHSKLLFSNWGIRSRLLKKRFGIGFSLENIGVLLKSYTDIKESIPALFRTAFYFKPKYLPLIMGGDIVRQLDKDLFYFSGGLELKPDSHLILRFGGRVDEKIKRFEDFTSNFVDGISGGFGFRFTRMALDVGLMNLGSAGFVVGFSLTKKLH